MGDLACRFSLLSLTTTTKTISAFGIGDLAVLFRSLLLLSFGKTERSRSRTLRMGFEYVLRMCLHDLAVCYFAHIA